MSRKAFDSSTEDILIGIYSKFPNRIHKYEYNFKNFHKFFYDNISNYGVLFGTDFCNNGEFYWSPKIERARESLIASKLLFNNSGFDMLDNSSIKFRWKHFTRSKFDCMLDRFEIYVLSNKFIDKFC